MSVAIVADIPSPVHPRACGEHLEWEPGGLAAYGSSPRLRGTFVAQTAHAAGIRFIPAPAGNMYRTARSRCLEPVHPRACGEHSPASDRGCRKRGSSPRLRGTYLLGRVRVLNQRFIPAPAGNMTSNPPVTYIHTVHPRACGEHYRVGLTEGLVVGSSPRLRGTLIGAGRTAHDGRFIPAPAGNISAKQQLALSGAVHPRACGEHTPANPYPRLPTGSSPRLRGTCRRGRGAPRLGRFIPAPAGNMP